MNNTTPKEEEDEEQGEVPSQQQEKEETKKNNNIKEEAQPPMKPAALPLAPLLQISPGEGNPNAGHEQGVDQPKIISNNNNVSNNNNRINFEEDQAMAGTVYHLYLHQTPDNMRQKMTFPELCRKYSAIAWCGKLNVIACASETCARHPSSNVQPPFWIPIHIVNPERPTEHTVFNVTADSPRDFVQFIEWSPIACPRALLIGNFNGRVNIWSQPTQGPPNLARAVNCWYCEHEWRQDLAVVTKWLSGMSPYRWMNASSNASANSKLTFEEKYLSQQTQTSARWPNFLCVCSVFSSGSVQLRWSQWPASQSGTSPKWFATNKGLLGAGPSGIMTADAIITEAGTMLVAGVPIVNPSTVVVWEVTPGFGNNPQSTLKTSTGIGVPPSLNPPSWAGFSPLAAYLFSWQEYLCTEGKNTQSQLDTDTIEGIVLNCSPVSNFSAYVSPEAAAQSAATTTWASGVSALAFDPSRGGSVLAVAIVEGQYMSPHNPDEGPSLTGWRVQRWESSHQQVALHPLFENSNSNSGGQSPMTTIWTTAVNRSIPPMKDFKSSLAGTTGNVAGSQVSVDSNSANIDKFNSDAVHQQSDVRMLAKIVFSGHGGEVAFAFRFGDVHLFSGSNFSPIDYYCASVGNTVALPAFSSTSCCLASVWHDNNKDCSVLKIVRILPPAVPSTPGKGNSSGWERAIAERIWWSLLVGVDWWDAVGCTQSAAEDDLVAINRVIAVLDADFHSLPTIQHRKQYGPALDRIKCRLLEGTVAQDVRALVLDMQARLLLDMLGKGIESALINPATLIPDPWQASSETLSTLGMDAMTVDPALVPSIQAYVDAILDLASHFLTRLRRYASFCRTLASHAVGVSASSVGNRNMGASPTTGGASPSPGQGAPGGTASNPGNTQMQAWVQGAIAKISSNAEGSPSTTPSSVNGPAPLLPLSVNTATFPGTPAVRLIGDCHFLHRLCQLLLFCLIFRRRQLPRFMSGLQRNPDVQSVKPQPGFGGKNLEEINQGASRPSSAMVVVKSEDGQGVRPGQLIPGFKGGLDEVSNTRPARLGHGNAGQGYTADEVKVLFLVLVDLCKRTAPSAHPLPKSQVGAANVNIRLHYIDGQYTVAPEVVEASLGPHMQNLPRPRGADAAGLLLRELELHPPAEDWHKRNMFGGPWSDLGDLEVCSDEQNISTTLGAVAGISDFSTGMFSDDYQSVKGLWPRKRRFSERDAAFGLKTAVGMGAYLGLMGSRRDVITASWKTGLHGAWHKCLRCGRQTSALALPNSSTSANQNNNLEPWWIGRWACGCPMCGGPWVHVV